LLRLTVLGDPDVVLELAAKLAEEAPASSPAGGALSAVQPDVRTLTPSPEERSAGQARHEVTVDGWVLQVRVEPAARATLRERARRGAAATHQHTREVVRARIPGRVVRVWVVPGQTVGAGERLVAVEAMKMENEVRAPRAGTVASISVQMGQPVELGSELLALD
jgi:biotin carboxyl carrier protein